MKFIHVVVCISLFSFIAEQYFVTCIFKNIFDVNFFFFRAVLVQSKIKLKVQSNPGASHYNLFLPFQDDQQIIIPYLSGTFVTVNLHIIIAQRP